MDVPCTSGRRHEIVKRKTWLSHLASTSFPTPELARFLRVPLSLASDSIAQTLHTVGMISWSKNRVLQYGNMDFAFQARAQQHERGQIYHSGRATSFVRQSVPGQLSTVSHCCHSCVVPAQLPDSRGRVLRASLVHFYPWTAESISSSVDCGRAATHGR